METTSGGPNVDLSRAKPAATAADAAKLQSQYQAQLDARAREGQVKLGFVTIRQRLISKQMVLHMTLKNSTRLDPEKTNI